MSGWGVTETELEGDDVLESDLLAGLFGDNGAAAMDSLISVLGDDEDDIVLEL